MKERSRREKARGKAFALRGFTGRAVDPDKKALLARRARIETGTNFPAHPNRKVVTATSAAMVLPGARKRANYAPSAKRDMPWDSRASKSRVPAKCEELSPNAVVALFRRAGPTGVLGRLSAIAEARVKGGKDGPSLGAIVTSLKGSRPSNASSSEWGKIVRALLLQAGIHPNPGPCDEPAVAIRCDKGGKYTPFLERKFQCKYCKMPLLNVTRKGNRMFGTHKVPFSEPIPPKDLDMAAMGLPSTSGSAPSPSGGKQPEEAAAAAAPESAAQEGAAGEKTPSVVCTPGSSAVLVLVPESGKGREVAPPPADSAKKAPLPAPAPATPAPVPSAPPLPEGAASAPERSAPESPVAKAADAGSASPGPHTLASLNEATAAIAKAKEKPKAHVLRGLVLTDRQVVDLVSEQLGFEVNPSDITVTRRVLPFVGERRLAPDRNVKAIEADMEIVQISCGKGASTNFVHWPLVWMLLLFAVNWIGPVAIFDWLFSTGIGIPPVFWTRLLMALRAYVVWRARPSFSAQVVAWYNAWIRRLVVYTLFVLLAALDEDFAGAWLDVVKTYHTTIQLVFYVYVAALLWTRKTRVCVVYAPHIVSSVILEYSRGTSAEVVRNTIRQRCMRLACLPVPDFDAVKIHHGSEIVAEFYMERQSFFEEGAESVTLPSSTPTPPPERPTPTAPDPPRFPSHGPLCLCRWTST